MEIRHQILAAAALIATGTAASAGLMALIGEDEPKKPEIQTRQEHEGPLSTSAYDPSYEITQQCWAIVARYKYPESGNLCTYSDNGEGRTGAIAACQDAACLTSVIGIKPPLTDAQVATADEKERTEERCYNTIAEANVGDTPDVPAASAKAICEDATLRRMMERCSYTDRPDFLVCVNQVEAELRRKVE